MAFPVLLYFYWKDEKPWSGMRSKTRFNRSFLRYNTDGNDTMTSFRRRFNKHFWKHSNRCRRGVKKKKNCVSRDFCLNAVYFLWPVTFGKTPVRSQSNCLSFTNYGLGVLSLWSILKAFADPAKMWKPNNISNTRVDWRNRWWRALPIGTTSVIILSKITSNCLASTFNIIIIYRCAADDTFLCARYYNWIELSNWTCSERFANTVNISMSNTKIERRVSIVVLRLFLRAMKFKKKKT